jgi:hypothetical protein
MDCPRSDFAAILTRQLSTAFRAAFFPSQRIYFFYYTHKTPIQPAGFLFIVFELPACYFYWAIRKVPVSEILLND